MPGRAERFFERPLGTPAQEGVRQRGIGPDRRDVSGAARRKAVVEFQSVGPFESADQLQHRNAPSGADVEDLVRGGAALFDQAVQGSYVGAGQIDDVDVVADAGAVGRRIVVAEDAQAFADPGGGLRHIGDQVLGYAARKLADQGRGMRADRVEVAQGDAPQTGMGGDGVAQDVFGDLFGVAVRRRGGLAGRLFGDGLGVGFAIYGAGGGKEDVGPSEIAHQLHDVQERKQVVAVVFERFGDRLPDRFRRGEVDDRTEFVAFEQPSHRLQVAAVDLLEGHFGARDAADALHGLKVGVREVVGDHHIESGLDQLDGRVRSDVSGAARYQYCFFHKAMSFEFLNF